jgi:signal transduction histidine kinase
MLRAWGLDDPETAREGAEAIHRESRHMRKLVEDLLALARGDERAPLKLGLHDLDALAAAAAGAAEVASGGRPSVRHVPADGPVQARFDRERLEQAVAILLDNAVKYTAEWGKTTVSTTRRDSGVMLEVSDTGKGVPEEDLPYVFERFYRADETRAARGSASR